MPTTGRSPRQIGAYRVAVRVSRNGRILVEGSDDRNILRRLIKCLTDMARIPAPIDIDTAEDLDSPPGNTLGNREKVEAVCAGLSQDAAPRFVGFVDREFRGFDLSKPVVSDDIGGHRLSDLLLWSRGHSIENYLLSFPVLSHAVQHYSDSHACYDALARLESVYDDVLRLACAIGLAAAQHCKLEAVRDSIRWNDLRLETAVMLDKAGWLAYITSKHPKLDAEAIFADITGWYDKLATCDADTVRWLCDGHAGLAVSLAAYQRAVHDVTGNDAKEADKSLNVRRKTCVLGGAIKWAQMACAGQTVWPEKLVELLSA